jgi:hypothetical protein
MAIHGAPSGKLLANSFWLIGQLYAKKGNLDLCCLYLARSGALFCQTQCTIGDESSLFTSDDNNSKETNNNNNKEKESATKQRFTQHMILLAGLAMCLFEKYSRAAVSTVRDHVTSRMTNASNTAFTPLGFVSQDIKSLLQSTIIDPPALLEKIHNSLSELPTSYQLAVLRAMETMVTDGEASKGSKALNLKSVGQEKTKVLASVAESIQNCKLQTRC